MSGWQDFHIGPVGHVQAASVEALVADAPYVGGAVTLAHEEVELLFQGVAHFFGKFFAGDKGHFQIEVLAEIDPDFLRFLGQVHEVAGSSHVAGHPEFSA